MKKRKNIGKILLVIAIALSFVTVAINALCVVALSLNLWGVADLYMQAMSNMGYVVTDLSSEISIICLELGLSALINLLAAMKYMRIFRMGGISKYSSPFSQTIWQMLMGSFVVGLLAMAGIIVLQKNRVEKDISVTKSEFEDYRMEAMSQAITRLKELKEQGAISEEEYYETLNKILES